MSVGLATCLSLGLSNTAWAIPDTGDTADTGDAGDTGEDTGDDTGDDTGADTGDATEEDTAIHIPGDGAGDLSGEKGGCQSISGSAAAAVFTLFIGVGGLRRRRE